MIECEERAELEGKTSGFIYIDLEALFQVPKLYGNLDSSVALLYAESGRRGLLP